KQAEYVLGPDASGALARAGLPPEPPERIRHEGKALRTNATVKQQGSAQSREALVPLIAALSQMGIPVAQTDDPQAALSSVPEGVRRALQTEGNRMPSWSSVAETL